MTLMISHKRWTEIDAIDEIDALSGSIFIIKK